MTSLPLIIPSGLIPVIKVNDPVTVGQIIAKKSSQREHILDLVKEFSLPPAKIRNTLRKKPGELVEIGDILAVKKNFFRTNEEKLVSRVKGRFARFVPETGIIIIDLGSDDAVGDLVSPVEGTVIICDNDKIVVGIDKNVYQGRKGAGGDAAGDVYILESAFSGANDNNDPSEISLYYTLDSGAVGKVVMMKFKIQNL